MRKTMLTLFGTVACIVALAIPAMAADQKSAVPSVWPAETLSGTVWTVDMARHVLTIKDPSGVPFDIVVPPSASIESGQKEIKFGDLLSAQKVSVKFVPEGRGDVAEAINVKSSS